MMMMMWITMMKNELQNSLREKTNFDILENVYLWTERKTDREANENNHFQNSIKRTIFGGAARAAWRWGG